MAPYSAPEIPASGITTQLVGDELLKCFESANREFAELLKQPVTDEALKQQVHQFVTTMFANCGVSLEDPTREGMVTTIARCKSNAEAMKGPIGAEIINHHYSEMMKLVDKLPE